ncbi:MAG: hypothetical protein JWO19_4383 [Bryobacterales bacterium]|nr:hypothetical protein [Bryobacterales bacterium]
MSTALNIPGICYERLEEWAKQLADRNATPLLVMGLGHGPTEGELHVFTMQGLSNGELSLFLAFALREIQRRAA